MFILKYKSIFIGISIALVAISLFAINTTGLKKGIDFTGGTVIEIVYDKTAPDVLSMTALKDLNTKAYQTGEGKFKLISSENYETLTKAIRPILSVNEANPYTETQVSTVGPSLGKEMTQKAMIAITMVVLAILVFISFAFRAVSLPVSSWKYGVIAMITLIHDIIIPAGVYVWLGVKFGAEVDTLFIIALLTVMGISISDKIVVFDRIRENLKANPKAKGVDFAHVVGKSLQQTFTRSVMTSLTVILALIALYVYGPEATHNFAITLIVGMIVGTYSSIFVASPLLVVLESRQK